MDGIKEIREKIILDAKTKAEEYKKQALADAENINKSNKEKAERQKAILSEKAAAEAEAYYKRLISMSELKLKQENLKLRQEIIDKTFDSAYNKLSSLSKDEYIDMIKKLIIKFVSTGNEEVILGSMYEKEAKAMINEINKENKYSLKVVDEDKKIKVGFILKSEFIEINNDFEALLRNQKEEDTLEIVEILFN